MSFQLGFDPYRAHPSPDSLHKEWPGWPSLRALRNHVPMMFLPSLLVISQGWGLIDLPLRASNEGFLKPRVARAQKIISLHPFFCASDPSLLHFQGRPGRSSIARVERAHSYRARSASRRTTRLPYPFPIFANSSK